MAVEIGSWFDILGEEVDNLIEVDVYNFLYMVSSAGGTDSNIACLGEEVDNLMEVDVYNFLHIVSSAGGTNSNTACLGEEVDDLMEVDEVTDCLI